MASNNLKAAAENEGQALLITKTNGSAESMEKTMRQIQALMMKPAGTTENGRKR